MTNAFTYTVVVTRDDPTFVIVSITPPLYMRHPTRAFIVRDDMTIADQRPLFDECDECYAPSVVDMIVNALTDERAHMRCARFICEHSSHFNG